LFCFALLLLCFALLCFAFLFFAAFLLAVEGRVGFCRTSVVRSCIIEELSRGHSNNNNNNHHNNNNNNNTRQHNTTHAKPIHPID